LSALVKIADKQLREDVMHRLCGILILVCMAIATLNIAVAAGAETGQDSSAEVAAIRMAANTYAAAVRSGDIEAMRRAWTADGDYIDASGQHYKSDELFAQDATSPASKTSPQTSVSQEPAPNSTLRLISPAVAIEDGAADIGVADDGSAITGRYTAVWVKHDGRWLLDSLREAISQTAQTNDRLQSLSWLLGEWAGMADNQAIVVSSNWSDGGNYIVREFAIRGAGDRVVTGTERIGWDPVSGEVMSWTFDSQGGRSESRWKREGERWLVESTKVMSDGKKATSASVYTPGDGEAYSWEVSRASIADERLPPVRIEFKRAAEEE
jgi:uncharacterized protein (TIGR02246 family)